MFQRLFLYVRDHQQQLRINEFLTQHMIEVYINKSYINILCHFLSKHPSAVLFPSSLRFIFQINYLIFNLILIFLIQILIINYVNNVNKLCNKLCKSLFYLSEFFFTNIHDLQDGGEGRGHFFNSFVPLLQSHRLLDISQAITAEGAPLHVASSWTGTWNPWFLVKSH